MNSLPDIYQKTNPSIWTGRTSTESIYLHEKVQCIVVSEETPMPLLKNSLCMLGYSCEEGVSRNLGRIGTAAAPDAIRKQLGKLPNHLPQEISIFDIGTVYCTSKDLEAAQEALAKKVKFLLDQGAFPILLGGGHDIAYAHYSGIQDYNAIEIKKKNIGIINFDAHFDLRALHDGGNSGTPFYQISEDCKIQGNPFHYLCLGIREDANDAHLFKTAKQLGVRYILNDDFTPQYFRSIKEQVASFIDCVDQLYVTIDMDGFSSAYAPGSSAASPMGFAPVTVLEVLKQLIDSKKIISLDVAEFNPIYDRDQQTAKLTASLLHMILHKQAQFLL